MTTVKMLRETEETPCKGEIVQATHEEYLKFNEEMSDLGATIWLERVYHGEFQEIDGERFNWYEVHELDPNTEIYG